MSPRLSVLLLTPSGGFPPHRPLPCYSLTTSQSDFLPIISLASPLRIVPWIAVFLTAIGRISQVPGCSVHNHATVYDPGRESCSSPFRCTSCCLPHDASASASTTVVLRGSIPSLSLRPDYSLSAASLGTVTRSNALEVAGYWLGITCIGF